MNRPMPTSDYVTHFDPARNHHRTWLQAVLERLVQNEPVALQEGGASSGLRGRRTLLVL